MYCFSLIINSTTLTACNIIIIIIIIIIIYSDVLRENKER